MNAKARAGRVLAVAGGLAVALATLTPADGHLAPSLCILCGDFGTQDMVLNILLFVPLGIGLAMSNAPRRRALAGMFVATVMIELTQLLAIPGRDASIGDVLSNTTGGALGFLIGAHMEAFIVPMPSLGASLAVGWFLVWLAVQGFVSFALRAAPTTGVYYGQHFRPLGDERAYEARMLSASVGEHPIPDTKMDDGMSVRASMLADTGAEIHVLLESTDRNPEFAPVLRILDARRREQLMIGVESGSIDFTVRTRASDLRLRPLQFRLSHALAHGAPRGARSVDTVGVTVRYARSAVNMRAWTGGDSTARQWPIRTSLGWRLVSPTLLHDERSPLDVALDALWIAGTLLMPGYWSALALAGGGSRRSRHVRWGVGSTLVVITGLVVIPLMGGLSPASVWEMAAAVVFLAAGHAWGVGVHKRARSSPISSARARRASDQASTRPRSN